MNDFEKFYVETKNGFFAYLLKLTGNKDDASDILQDSYEKMLKKYKDSPVKTLLYKIGYNLFIDNIRKSKHISDSNEQINYISSKENVQDNLIIQEKYNAVINIIGTLSANERNIISLITTGELSYKEIGQITGLNEQNIKVKVHRIRKKIKEIMKKEGVL